MISGPYIEPVCPLLCDHVRLPPALHTAHSTSMFTSSHDPSEHPGVRGDYCCYRQGRDSQRSYLSNVIHRVRGDGVGFEPRSSVPSLGLFLLHLKPGRNNDGGDGRGRRERDCAPTVFSFHHISSPVLQPREHASQISSYL